MKFYLVNHVQPVNVFGGGHDNHITLQLHCQRPREKVRYIQGTVVQIDQNR